MVFTIKPIIKQQIKDFIMIFTKPYRRLKYLVISLLFLISLSRTTAKEFGGFILPNFTITGKDINISTDILSTTFDEKGALQFNIFNFQVRNGYLDNNGRTQNLVSYLGLIESAYLYTLLNIGIETERIRPNSLIVWLGSLMFVEKILTNSKFHFYWKMPEISDDKLDWYSSVFLGTSSALYSGKDINYIFNYRPEIGMRLGLNKVLKIFHEISDPFPNRNEYPNNPINPFVEKHSTESFGIYFDFGYLSSLDFQKGSKPIGVANCFFSVGISSGFKK